MRLGTMAAGLILAASLPTAILPAASRSAAAQDVAAGRRVAGRVCATCHGVDGIAKQPDAANLAGQDATYLARQLAAFRSGGRVNEQMSVLAKMLTDQQVADVAAYYAAVKIEVVSVP